MLRAFSFGGGVQSTAALVLQAAVGTSVVRGQVKQAVCAALNCRRRKDLVSVKTFTFGGENGLLLEIDLCPEHEAQHNKALHATFLEHFGQDFVDAERN